MTNDRTVTAILCFEYLTTIRHGFLHCHDIDRTEGV